MPHCLRLLHAFVLLVLLLAGRDLPAAQAAAPAAQAATLAQLALWPVPGIGSLAPGADLSAAPALFSTTVTAAGQALAVVGFRRAAGQPFTLAVHLPRFGFGTVAPALAASPAADIAFDHAVLLLVPPGGGGDVALPSGVDQWVGAATVRVAEGVNFRAVPQPFGRVGTFLTGAGVAGLGSITPPMTGRFDPGVLLGRPAGGSDAFLQGLELVVALNQPAGHHFMIHGGQMGVIGADNKVVAAQSLVPPAGSAVVQQKVAAALSDLLACPTPSKQPFPPQVMAALAQIPVHAPQPHAAAGNAPAYYSATAEIRGTGAEVVVFTPTGADCPLAAIAMRQDGQSGGSVPLNVDLAAWLPQLPGQPAPLQGLDVRDPLLVLVPSGFDAPSVVFPAGIQPGPDTRFQPGLNVRGRAFPRDPRVLDLLRAAGIAQPGAGFAFGGSLDPLVLSPKASGEGNQSALLATVQLWMDTGALRLVDGLLTGSDSQLALKGLARGVQVSLAAPLTVNMPGARPIGPFASTLEVVAQAAAEPGKPASVQWTLDGICEGTVSDALGITGFNLIRPALSIRPGTSSPFTVLSKADLGRVRGLDATLGVRAATATRPREYALTLTGADIPLLDVPQFDKAGVPLSSLADARLRNVTLSNLEVAGTLVTGSGLFNGLQAVLWRDSRSVSNLALHKPDVALRDLGLPPVPALDKARFDHAVFVLSTGGVRGAVADLPPAAAALLGLVYQDAGTKLDLGNGVNVVFGADASQLGALGTSLGDIKGRLVFAGGVEGLFGGPMAYRLAAAIPPAGNGVSPLPKVKMLGLVGLDPLPSAVQLAVIVKQRQGEAPAAGLAVSGDLSPTVAGKRVQVNAAVDFVITPEGGFAVDSTATLLAPWVDPLGLPGITFDPGTVLGVGITAATEVKLTVAARTHLGKRQANLSGCGVVLPEGAVERVAVAGSVSEMDLRDAVALADAAVKASGKSLPPVDFPDVQLRKVDYQYATPGAACPGITLVGGGERFSGELWLGNKRSLGRATGQVDANGLLMSGAMGDLRIGPVALAGNQLDVRATVAGAVPRGVPLAPGETDGPYFKIIGGGTVLGKQERIIATLSSTAVALSMGVDLGDLLKLDLSSAADVPGGFAAFSPEDVKGADLMLNGRLRADLPDWLRRNGPAYLEGALHPVITGLEDIVKGIEDARRKVDDLNRQIDAMRGQVNRERGALESRIRSAEGNVNGLQNQIRDLDNQIAAARSHIHTCDYTKRVPYAWRPLNHTYYANVPDPVKNGECAGEDAYYGSQVGGMEAARGTLAGAKAAADRTLSSLRAGVADIPVDLDPRVFALIVARDAAQASLAVAEEALKDLDRGPRAIEDAIRDLPGVFVLRDSHLRANLPKGLAGGDAALSLSYEVAGRAGNAGVAFRVNDAAFDAKHMGLVSLQAVRDLLDQRVGKDSAMKPFMGLVNSVVATALAPEHTLLAGIDADNGIKGDPDAPPRAAPPPPPALPGEQQALADAQHQEHLRQQAAQQQAAQQHRDSGGNLRSLADRLNAAIAKARLRTTNR